MEISLTEVFMFVGFVFAAYSIVANDAIQTLGTFLSSNSHRPWWVLWLFACTVLVVVLVTGWVINYGDPAWGRLSKFPEPEGGITWIHAVPPIFILLLTRFGVPVSTTFLVLTVFAPTNLESMLMKSAGGYFVAIVVGLVLYLIVSRIFERYFMESDSANPKWYWVVAQWASTAFLWSQWLIQDLANIFVYLPRTIDVPLLAASVILMLLLHAIIFARRGGEIQAIVTSKTNTTDIRSATIIDLTYGIILLVFKQMSEIPMSTTWVFLGLLAGREIALTFMVKHRPMREAFVIAAKDMGKAILGLAVSIGLAFGLPVIDRMITGGASGSGAAPGKGTAVAQMREDGAVSEATGGPSGP